MGVHVIKMPDIGEGIAEVELVAWRVQPGDAVIEDQVLADVMTDKATVEIPSPVVGKVLALTGQPGQVMAVGTELIRIEVAGEGNLAAAKAAPRAAPSLPAAPAVAVVASVRPEPVPRGAGEHELRAAAPAAAPSARAPGDKPTASPSVRQRAREMGVELRSVRGSGPGGRVVHADLDAWAARAVAPPAAPATRLAERHDEQAIPVIGLRRRIAQRMQDAKRRIPHFSYVEEVDVSELELLRAELNGEHAAQRGKLTLLPFVARAIALAAREHPQVNARFDDEAGIVTRHGAVHLGIATQTPHGLMVPVLRHAEARELWDCAAEIGRLAAATRAGQATRDELSGSTLTITSLGPLGGIVTTPIINPPEVAIVGVNRIVERPVIRAGAVVARKMMNLSSSFDHRVVDGADAAAFVQAIRRRLECPALLFVE